MGHRTWIWGVQSRVGKYFTLGDKNNLRYSIGVRLRNIVTCTGIRTQIRVRAQRNSLGLELSILKITLSEAIYPIDPE